MTWSSTDTSRMSSVNMIAPLEETLDDARTNTSFDAPAPHDSAHVYVHGGTTRSSTPVLSGNHTQRLNARGHGRLRVDTGGLSGRALRSSERGGTGRQHHAVHLPLVFGVENEIMLGILVVP